jgi:hypothetical protein
MDTPMRSRLLAGALAVAVLLAALAVACGGGGDEEATEATVAPSPGATVVPTATPSAVEQQLNGMVLQLSDLPAGFAVAQESFSTNQEVAGDGEGAAEVLASLTEWGRILGHGVVFSSEASEQSGVLVVDSTVSLYQNDGGAAASFADAVVSARATDWQAAVAEATDVQVEELPPLDVADEMLWLRVSGTASVGDPAAEQPFIQDVVLFRVGRARGSVSTLASATDAALLVESMVRTQAANMAAGLQ